MNIKKAILKSFNSNTYTATIRINGSSKAYLENINVARNIPAIEMTAGRKVAVLFFDNNNSKDSVIIAVYT